MLYFVTMSNNGVFLSNPLLTYIYITRLGISRDSMIAYFEQTCLKEAG